MQELSFVWNCVLWFGSPLMSSNGEKYSRGHVGQGGNKHPCTEDEETGKGARRLEENTNSVCKISDVEGGGTGRKLGGQGSRC